MNIKYKFACIHVCIYIYINALHIPHAYMPVYIDTNEYVNIYIKATHVHSCKRFLDPSKAKIDPY